MIIKEYKCCCQCGTKKSELGVHNFNLDKLFCLSCDVKRSKSR